MEHKIGLRQRQAWICAGWSAVTACCICGVNWVWVLIGCGLVGIYHGYLERKSGANGLAAELVIRWNGVGRAVNAVILIWSVIMLAWTATLSDQAFPTVDGFPVLGWIMLALTGWGVQKGMKACARCCGVLCLFLLGLYGVILIFGLPDMRWMADTLPKGGWTEGLTVIGICLLPTAIWYAPGSGSQRRNLWVLFPVLLSGMLALVAAGILSPELAAEEETPLYLVAQSIRLFGVMERMESLLSAAILMGVFAQMSGLAVVCQCTADQLRPCRWSGIAACAGAGIVMLFVEWIPQMVLLVGNSVVWLLIPILVTQSRN